jgi:hypothetical protein
VAALRHYLVRIPKRTAFVGDDTLGYFTKQLDKAGQPPLGLTVGVVPNPKPWRQRLGELDGALVFDAKAS